MTKREKQILRDLAHGLTQKEIARKYCLHIRTVEAAVSSIKRKSSAKTIAQAVFNSIRVGLLACKSALLVVALCWSCVYGGENVIRIPRARIRISRQTRRFD